MVWARETDNLRLKFLSATSKWALWVTCDSATCVIWSVTWDSTSWHCWDGREGYEFHCPLPSLAQSNHSKAIFTCNSGIGKNIILKPRHLDMAPVGSEDESVSRSVVSLFSPMDCSLPGSSVHGIFQARILEWAANSLFQGIFPTRGLNPGLRHYRQILYHLSHQGSLVDRTSGKDKPEQEEVLGG